MRNYKIKFVLRAICFIMASVMLDIFSFAAGPSDESISADPALGSSSPINIKLPCPLFIDTAAARSQAQKAAEIEAAEIEAARIGEANRIQEEQQARIDAKKKRNRRRQQRKQQNQKKQSYMQQKQQSEEEQFIQRMQKYMR